MGVGAGGSHWPSKPSEQVPEILQGNGRFSEDGDRFWRWGFVKGAEGHGERGFKCLARHPLGELHPKVGAAEHQAQGA